MTFTFVMKQRRRSSGIIALPCYVYQRYWKFPKNVSFSQKFTLRTVKKKHQHYLSLDIKPSLDNLSLIKMQLFKDKRRKTGGMNLQN